MIRVAVACVSLLLAYAAGFATHGALDAPAVSASLSDYQRGQLTKFVRALQYECKRTDCKFRSK